jgi:hypothetical protein
MKQNAENSLVEEGNQGPDLHIVETPASESRAATVRLPSTRRVAKPRPEVAVLGWKERFYRLTLRESKV